MYNIVSYNKDYFPANSFKPELTNRAFKYGDGFFETMHANGMRIQFIGDHMERVYKACDVLKMVLPDFFSKDFLEKQVAGLLSRMKLFQGVRVRVTFIRAGQGLYTPQQNTCNILIEASYLSKGGYELNHQGLTIGLYKDHPYVKTPLSGFKSLNALPYILAANYAKAHGFDDVLLVDAGQNIVEATSSNFFAVKGTNLFTPSLQYGGVSGIMRKQILKIAPNIGLKVFETQIKPSEITNMDELFLTNVIAGIKFISGFSRKRYFKRTAKKLVVALNDRAF